ncbi:MAG: hypothetical protein B7733_08540 [Myxococcales bacterium FL481]|nr:MAG: hypothetical protein B7733_08540 [Myxococcales bacterium FL481]
MNEPIREALRLTNDLITWGKGGPHCKHPESCRAEAAISDPVVQAFLKGEGGQHCEGCSEREHYQPTDAPPCPGLPGVDLTAELQAKQEVIDHLTKTLNNCIHMDELAELRDAVTRVDNTPEGLGKLHAEDLMEQAARRLLETNS